MKSTLTKILVLGLISFVVSCSPNANQAPQQQSIPEVYSMDEFDPNPVTNPNVEAELAAMDAAYFAETGQSPFEDSFSNENLFGIVAGCVRMDCPVYALVRKSEQRMYLYENGALIGTYKTSTGTPGHGTPDFDTRPDGRIYDKYTSTKYPGGDYNGLGNMPYAVFIRGGYAIHGTGKSNWPKLGQVASHGCIRLHPDNGFIFNRLVRKYGTKQTWIRVIN